MVPNRGGAGGFGASQIGRAGAASGAQSGELLDLSTATDYDFSHLPSDGSPFVSILINGPANEIEAFPEDATLMRSDGF
jgi:hypothetical protein